MRKTRITATDIMDADEVAEAFGVKASSLYVAMSTPDAFPSLAAKLPAPLRRVGRSWVWARTDVEAAVKEAS
jgi:predicted DNA-binding transcriptional regulator AlpA